MFFTRSFISWLTLFVRRFSPAYTRLANAFWPQNLVIVTHGYGVQEAVVKGGGQRNTFADYCGFVELTRTTRDSDKWTDVNSGNVDKF